ncbi:hypothetical protein [Mycolicibacterium vaccae]|uniref:Uncharacterized protein n=1 Tax=Mycolicibacterium vaccae ATCC 25954 TaxID=1194972 RepID=K0V1A7_MYCVA|nr:hypothetical protein [Mycolicibacterium vaccae]EJZ11110.1 hypothetical protein MVAC_06617 [Mycolicibacterium vaccae ATCC 25954]MCV7061803.1 hypothetical protein [Mycolicibacterium vaccae]
MTAPVKIATFVAMLAVVFAVSLWVGHTVGPAPAPGPASDHSHLHEGDHR